MPVLFYDYREDTTPFRLEKMTTYEDINSKILNRIPGGTLEEHAAEIRTAMHILSRRRMSSKVRFDFDDEGHFDAGRGTKKFEAGMGDMARALKWGAVRHLRIFRNANKGVTIACVGY